VNTATLFPSDLEAAKTYGAMESGQSRDSGNIWHKIQSDKSRKCKVDCSLVYIDVHLHA